MLSIRLSRVGKRRAPIYRIVVIPKHRDPWAKFVEILGHYNPRQTPHAFVVNTERVKYWLSQGAEASDTVWNLLVDEKVVEGEKRSVTHISGTRAKKLEKEAAETKVKVDEAAAKAEATKKSAEVVEETKEAPTATDEAPMEQQN